MDRQKFFEQLGPLADKPIDLADYPKFSFKLNKQIIEFSEIQQILKLQSFGPNNTNKKGWTDEAFKLLIWVIIKYSESQNKDLLTLAMLDWQQIASVVEWKDMDSCKFKWLTSMKTNIQQKMWTQQEDQLLYQIIVENRMTFHWNEIAQEMYNRSQGVYFRKGKQYRERWNNYLNPQMKRGIWTEEEDVKLIELALQLGLRWSLVAKKLTQRTENNVKNRFKSLINKERKLRSLKLVQPENIDVDMKLYEDKYSLDREIVELMITIIKRIKNSQQVKPQEFQNLNSVQQTANNGAQIKQEDYLQILQNQFLLNQQLVSQQNYQLSLLQMQQIQQYYFQQSLQMLSPMQQMGTFQQLSPIPNSTLLSLIQQPLNYNVEQPLVKQELPIEQTFQSVSLGSQIPTIKQQEILRNVQSQNSKSMSIASNYSQKSDQIKEESSCESDQEPAIAKQYLVSNPSSAHNISTNSNGSIDILRKKLINIHINSPHSVNQKNKKKNSLSANSQESSPGFESDPKEIRKVRGGSQQRIDEQMKEEQKDKESPKLHHKKKNPVKKLSRFYYQSMEQE